MATTPGILTDWPWKHLGSYKYVLLAPWVIQSVHEFATSKDEDGHLFNLLIFPFAVSRLFHAQLWISLSRYQTARGKSRIVDRSLDFEQVDRERNWDDQILLSSIIYYVFNRCVHGVSHMPVWRLEGAILVALMHAGPVEFLYYWFHRALHHHYLYSRYHSHHHSSIVTEPITSVIHPFAEVFAYVVLFSLPQLAALCTGTLSMVTVFIYLTYIDFMNYMGHCNFEIIPKQLFAVFPPLKHLLYTPSFHSLHHTQFRTNYSLFMPLYDYIYGTMDKSSDILHQASLQKPEEFPDVVHLTHLTTPQSLYHLNFGFASLSSMPLASKWYLWTMWPITFLSMTLTWIYGRTFVVENNTFEKLRLQTWSIPRYNIHYSLKWQREAINNLIEQAVQEADDKGAKVLSLGLMNQGDELNRNGQLYMDHYNQHPKLRVKIVDGSSLAVAVVLNSIPQGATQVLFSGKLTKVGYAIALALCHKGIQVAAASSNEEVYEKLKIALGTEYRTKLILSKGCSQKIWLVGDGLTENEQLKASKGTVFIPFSQFPLKKTRKNCFYLNPPAMKAPPSFENLHTCENWLPRRMMSAWRVAGVLHALEGWDVHECGDTVFDVVKVWEAALRHGFRPLPTHHLLSDQLSRPTINI